MPAAKLHGNEFDPASGRMLFREAAGLWLDDRKASLKATTYAAHAERLAPTTGASKTRHARLTYKGQPLRIDPAFGGYPLNKITHDDAQAWVNRLVASGRQPSTVRNLFFVVRQVLAWAVMTKKLSANPAEHVQLPGSRTASVAKGANRTAPKRSRRRDDLARFLTAAQVSVLAAATPWPYSVFVHTDAWTGLRPGEMIGLRVGDVHLAGEDAEAGESRLSVAESVAVLDGESVYLDPKTEGSIRDVPLTADTAAGCGRTWQCTRTCTTRTRRCSLAFPRCRFVCRICVGANRALSRPVVRQLRYAMLRPKYAQPGTRTYPQPIGKPSPWRTCRWKRLPRGSLWIGKLRCGWTPSARPSGLRPSPGEPHRQGDREARHGSGDGAPGVTPYALRHTYASLSAAAGIKPLALSRRMGHAAVTMTMNVYAHLYRESAADDMAALGAMAIPTTPTLFGANVIPMRG